MGNTIHNQSKNVQIYNKNQAKTCNHKISCIRIASYLVQEKAYSFLHVLAIASIGLFVDMLYVGPSHHLQIRKDWIIPWLPSFLCCW